ncbi:MAG: hypothetical protein E6J73_15360 [Deltaproteobacteria bacterium]|nr:MAG: hypothetical protein E6J73_15360 [Deltaproteobacteria bacterium]
MSRKYVITLRCIAQDLERRGLKTFDIRLLRDEYIVECGYQDPPSPTPVTIHYTLMDIDELDRVGEDKRGEPPLAKDFLNQIQIFRTIGGYLDKNEARLIRITNNDAPGKDSIFTVEYITRDGEHMVDDRARSALYDMCVVMYKQRGKLTGTGGRRSRRRG